MSDSALLNSVTALLYREAEYVDERRWDEWLALFDPQAEYWIPSWDSEDEYTRDPQTEISLMYYGDRTGLEDRVFRLRTGRSAASTSCRTCVPHWTPRAAAASRRTGSRIFSATVSRRAFTGTMNTCFCRRPRIWAATGALARRRSSC